MKIFPLLGVLLLGGGLITSAFALPMVGKVMIGPEKVLYQTVPGDWLFGKEIGSERSFARGAALEFEQKIYWKSRFPRTLFAMFAGAGLALSGMVFQALFRNPLATPYTLGIASGAALGNAFFTLYGGTLVGTNAVFLLRGVHASIAFSFAGALGAMFLVYSVSRSRNCTSESLLLAGVAVNFFFSSLMLFLQYLSDPGQTFRMLRYTMGGFDAIPKNAFFYVVPVVLLGSLAILVVSRSLNILATGEERAVALGIDVKRFRLFLFVLTSLLVGTIVAVAGPIGFVGMMVPHICRFLTGADHRLLAPASLLFGAFFLAACDTIACSILNVGNLPVGIITNLLGGPFFIMLLIKRNF